MGHIITGNLDIVEDNNLKNILKKGCSHRIQKAEMKQDIYTEIIICAFDQYVNLLAKRNNIPVTQFPKFKENFVNFIDKNKNRDI